jgi:protein arginine kinase activator
MKEKCQRCSKTATFHITDIERGQVREYHLCDEHARQHVAPAEAGGGAATETSTTGAKPGRPRREPTAADKRACPYCQLTFQEFKNSGRLGCPHDYDVFRDDLMPLLENIHDNTRHEGKSPCRAPRSSQKQSDLIDLRKRLKQAIEIEDYETAANLRDQIKSFE